MTVGDRNDPYRTFNFLVEIESLVIGGFSEVTGLRAEIEVKKFREGGLNEYMHKLAGPAAYPSNIVLKKGLADTAYLWSWYKEAAQGKIKRQNGSIIMRDDAGKEIYRWNFHDAYPVKWAGPNMRANAAELAVETLELAHNRLELA